MSIPLAHRRSGSGEPLVALHGIGSTWQAWEPVLPALEARHDVLSLSLPGYGESPPVAGEPTVPALVDAVEQAMDLGGLETAHLVGNSLGGWIAAELAARGRARSVVGLSPAGLWTRRELDYSTATLRLSWIGARLLAPHADRATATPARRRILFAQVCAHPGRIAGDAAAFQLRMLAGSSSFSRTLAWIHRGYRMPLGLNRIDVPFRVAWGTRDVVLPARQGPRWAAIVAGADLVRLPGAGHVPMSDDPGLVAATVLEVTAGAREPAV